MNPWKDGRSGQRALHVTLNAFNVDEESTRDYESTDRRSLFAEVDGKGEQSVRWTKTESVEVQGKRRTKAQG